MGNILETSIRALELEIDLGRVRMQMVPTRLTWMKEAADMAREVRSNEKLLRELKMFSTQVVHKETETC